MSSDVVHLVVGMFVGAAISWATTIPILWFYILHLQDDTEVKV